MRVAVAGKGGAGKTTLSATMARVAAAAGRATVLVDADSNPNLAVAVGIGPLEGPPVLPTGLVSRRLDGPALTEDVEDVLGTHGVAGPDGIRLVHMGMPAHAEEGCMCAAHAVVSATLGDLGEQTETLTVVDMEASPEHFSRGTARNVDTLLLVGEPYFRSLETVRRMAELAAGLPIPQVGLVGNKLRDEKDHEALAEFAERHGLDLLATLPWSDAVLDADRDRVALIEAAPDDGVVTAVRSLLTRLEGERTPAPA